MKKILYLFAFFLCVFCSKKKILKDITTFSHSDGRVYRVVFEPHKHKQLPEDIDRRFPHLEELVFSNNMIMRIPPSILKLRKMRLIEGYNNQMLYDIPDLGKLEQLEELNLNGMHAYDMRKIDWSKLQKLKKILMSSSNAHSMLSYNSHISFNPGNNLWGIAGIQSVEHLDLRDWPLRNDQALGVHSLTNLKSLKLASQELTVDKNFATMILNLGQGKEDFFLQLERNMESKIISRAELNQIISLKITNIEGFKEFSPNKMFPILVFWNGQTQKLCTEYKNGDLFLNINPPTQFWINEDSFVDEKFTQIKLALITNRNCTDSTDDLYYFNEGNYTNSAYLFLKN